jgi:hypothetical protein
MCGVVAFPPVERTTISMARLGAETARRRRAWGLMVTERARTETNGVQEQKGCREGDSGFTGYLGLL